MRKVPKILPQDQVPFLLGLQVFLRTPVRRIGNQGSTCGKFASQTLLVYILPHHLWQSLVFSGGELNIPKEFRRFPT